MSRPVEALEAVVALHGGEAHPRRVAAACNSLHQLVMQSMEARVQMALLLLSNIELPSGWRTSVKRLPAHLFYQKVGRDHAPIPRPGVDFMVHAVAEAFGLSYEIRGNEYYLTVTLGEK